MVDVDINVAMLQYDTAPIEIKLVLSLKLVGSFHPLTRAPYQGMSFFSDHPHRNAQNSEKLDVKNAPRIPARASRNTPYRSTDFMHQFRSPIHAMPGLRLSGNPKGVVDLVKQ